MNNRPAYILYTYCECELKGHASDFAAFWHLWSRAVRRRTGGRRQRWVVLWPAAAASDRMREHWNSALAGQAFFSGTLKTRDWKMRDLKSMESVTIFKSKSYGAEIKTVYGGMDTWSRVFFDFYVTLCTVICDFLHWTTWSFSDMLCRTCYCQFCVRR